MGTDECNAFSRAEVRENMKKRLIRKEIREMVKRIAERFDPERIILFGSHARGEAGPDSDVDLLVVMKIEESKRAKQLELHSVHGDIHVPKDVIVSTSEEFEWRVAKGCCGHNRVACHPRREGALCQSVSMSGLWSFLLVKFW